MASHEVRINGFHKSALLSVAFAVDFLQFIFVFIPILGLFLSTILTVFARIVFWVWLRILGVGFADKSNRYFLNIAVLSVEILPFLNNVIPGWGVGTFFIIRQVEKEDAEKQKEMVAEMKVPMAANDNEVTLSRQKRRIG